jgi:hypothetical protein
MVLLVTATTSSEDIERHRKRISKIHSTRSVRDEDDIEMVTCSSDVILGGYVEDDARLYAVPAVGEQLAKLSEIRYWTEHFFLVTWAKAGYGKNNKSRDLPLYVCREGAPGLKKS